MIQLTLPVPLRLSPSQIHDGNKNCDLKIEHSVTMKLIKSKLATLQNFTLYRDQAGFTQAPKFNGAGFTLIEILVVFTIITVLSGIGILSLVVYGRTQQISQTASNIKLLIGQAKFNSLSAVKTNTSDAGAQVTCGTDSLDGYVIDVIGENAIDLSQVCNGTATRIKRVTLPQNMEFDVTTTCTSVSFAPLSGSTSGAPCDIIITGYGLTKTVSVDLGGNVTIN